MGDDDKLTLPLQLHSFTVGPRYTDLKPLGFGGNGLVCSAVDSECDKHVAIKKIAFSDRKSCKQALREIKVIRRLRHENIVRVYEILSSHGDNIDLDTTTNISEFRTVYLIQELLDTDLHRLIQTQTLSGGHIKLIMYQLLRGLKYIHSANVLHRDLKPSNLLINLEDLTLRIGDFGLARIVDPMYCHKGYLSENVSTRWYRSPELMLTPNNYTKGIDVWSCGCILAELLLGKPIFPGANEVEQLTLILEAVPSPIDDMDKILNLVPKNVLKNYQGQPRHPLRERFPNIDRDALNLLECLLTFDPRDRITTEEALLHPYMNLYSYPPDEPIMDQPFYIENEVDDLSPSTLKKILINESSNLHWHDNAVGADNEALPLSNLSIRDRFLDNSESEISEEDLMNRSFTELELENHFLQEAQDDQGNMNMPNKLVEQFSCKLDEEEGENKFFERKLALDYESESSEKSDNDGKEDVRCLENKTGDESDDFELEEKLQMEVAENEKVNSQDGENVVDKKDKCKLNVACSGKLKDRNEADESELANSEKEDSEEERKAQEDVEKCLKVDLKKDCDKERKESDEKTSSEGSRHSKAKKETESVKRKVKANCGRRNSKEEYHDREKSLQHCLEIDRFLPDDSGGGGQNQSADQNSTGIKKKICSKHKACENQLYDCVFAEGHTSPTLQHKVNEIRKMELERSNVVKLSLLGRQKGLEDYKQQLHIELPVKDMECTSGPNSPRSPRMYSPRGEKSVRPKKYNTKPKGK